MRPSVIASRIPPIGHLRHDGGFQEIGFCALGVVSLVENQIQIAAGTVDVVEQKVRGYHIPVTVPLGEEFGKEACGEGIVYATAEDARVE